MAEQFMHTDEGNQSMIKSNDNDDIFRTGAQLLSQWGCTTREQKLERAVMALMSNLNDLHRSIHGQDLKVRIADETVTCSCADAYRMGDEALKA